MKRTSILALAILAAVVVCPGPAFARLGTSEVSGVVKTQDGDPVKGAVVTFTNVTTSSAEYTAKTNKKGRYFIPNLLYYTPGLWNVTVDAEGLVPRQIEVESRKSDKTLLGEPYETGMRPDQPHEVKIAAFGKASIDFVMVPERSVVSTAVAASPEGAGPGAAELVGEARAGAAAAGGGLFAKAQQKVADGDLEGSLELFERAIEEKPDEVEGRELYAKVLYNVGRYAEAERTAREVAEAEPDRPGLQLLFADIYAKQGKHDQALEALTRVAAESEDDVGVFKRMAFVAEKAGDLDRAVQANRKIVEFEPGNVEAWLALGDLHARAGRMEESRAAYSKVAALDPGNAYKTFFNIGVLLENKEDPTPAEERRAVEAYRQAVKIKPDYAQAHRRLAYALLRTGNLPGAKDEFERLLELEPGAADAGEIRSLIDALPD